MGKEVFSLRNEVLPGYLVQVLPGYLVQRLYKKLRNILQNTSNSARKNLLKQDIKWISVALKQKKTR